MVSTWIEAPAQGRHGGPVRAGMWAAVVIGTHPVETDQEVWLEIAADDVALGPLPAYWIENKGFNSFWHVPIPPQAVAARLRYRSAARHAGAGPVVSGHQDVLVRPNTPDQTDAILGESEGPEGLVGNRTMTARVDARGGTYDVYFPSVGLHSDVRPAEGDLPRSRSNFHAIVGGLAVGRRLDWFNERLAWEAFQHYQGATNLLVTELRWRRGPLRVVVTDFAAAGDDLPATAGGTDSPGQYIKRFRVFNEGGAPLSALFGVYVQAEVNGGVGEPGLSWHDGERTLLATNRGHGHANRKLARDATVEFALAFDGRGEVVCEPTGPNEAMMLRRLELPAGGDVTVEMIVSGAFTGWRGDSGTFDHWLRPALRWFRAADLDAVEQATAARWDEFVEPLPEPKLPKPSYAVTFRRSALAAALHADEKWGGIASGFDRGLHAYCWPRAAVWAGAALDRAGHPEVGRAVFGWLARVRGRNRPYQYWFQKYTIDGWPEWETPAVDQTALIPWALERHYRRTGDLDFVAASWPMVEQAAGVCGGASGHPGLRLIDDLALVSSAGIWDNRYGAFFYSNACVVAGLRAAARLGVLLDKPAEQAQNWEALADRIWQDGVLGRSGEGLLDPDSGRFLDARRLSTRRGLWSDRPEDLIDRSAAVDISLLGAAVPFGLLPPDDERVRRTADAILRHNALGGDPHVLSRWTPDPADRPRLGGPSESHQQDPSALAILWMARYLIALGRSTGDGRPWARAVAMLDALIERLGPLGLGMRTSLRRGGEAGSRGARPTQGVWNLHAMYIETLLDLTGLDYDAADRRLSLRPALPPAWPSVGQDQRFACGAVSYRLERADDNGPTHRLAVETLLAHPVRLDLELTCPGLTALGDWSGPTGASGPRFLRGSSRLALSLELPEGESRLRWAWGAAHARAEAAV